MSDDAIRRLVKLRSATALSRGRESGRLIVEAEFRKGTVPDGFTGGLGEFLASPGPDLATRIAGVNRQLDHIKAERAAAQAHVSPLARVIHEARVIADTAHPYIDQRPLWAALAALDACPDLREAVAAEILRGMEDLRLVAKRDRLELAARILRAVGLGDG